jgi:hypothetical protein
MLGILMGQSSLRGRLPLTTVSHYAGDEGQSHGASSGKWDFSRALFQGAASQLLDNRFTEPVAVDPTEERLDDRSHQRGFSVNIIPIGSNEKLNVSVAGRRCCGCIWC